MTPDRLLSRSTRLPTIGTMMDSAHMDTSSDDSAKSQNYREMAEAATSADIKADLLRLAERYDSAVVPTVSVDEAEKEPADGVGIESV
jgi:hypothetical protein